MFQSKHLLPAILIVVVGLSLAYYFFVFQPRKEYSLVLLRSCLESLNLKDTTQLNTDFFKSQSDPATGLWACEEGARMYMKSGKWHFE